MSLEVIGIRDPSLMTGVHPRGLARRLRDRFTSENGDSRAWGLFSDPLDNTSATKFFFYSSLKPDLVR